MTETQLAVVEVSEADTKLLQDYDTFIDARERLNLSTIEGSTFLSDLLYGIKDFEPGIITSHKPQVAWKSKKEELTDKVHQMAIQWSKYYDRRANENPKFEPYWSQRRRFKEVNEEFPAFITRDFLESYNRFLKINDLEGRLRFNKILDEFKEFYPERMNILTAPLKVPSFKELEKEYKSLSWDKITHPLLYVGGPGATLSSLLEIVNTPVDTNTNGLAAIAFVSGIIATVISIPAYEKRKDDEVQKLADCIYWPITKKSQIAEDTISLIKERAA